MTVRIGVDVGATSIRGRLSDGDRDVRVDGPTSAAGGAAVTERIGHVVEDLLSRSGHARVDALGVGVPGIVDVASGTVRHAVNLGIDGTPYPLRDRLTAALRVPTQVDNDARVAALGALGHLRSTGLDISDLVYLSVGTGISAGIVIDGRLHRGRNGSAGEIGHAPLAGTDVSCRCGQQGCLEAIASGRAIVEITGRSAEDLFSEEPPSPEATRIGLALARAIRVMAAVHDPDVFVLGGGIGPHAAEAVAAAVTRLAEGSAFAETLLGADRLVTLPPDVDAGTTGALLLTTSKRPQDRHDHRQEGHRWTSDD